jgi:nucleotide-binding universal stress UspA family protein
MAVQEFVDKVAGEIGETAPEVTVTVATGDATEERVRASHDADMLVLGSRGSGGVHQASHGFSEQPGHAPRVLPVVIIPGTREVS